MHLTWRLLGALGVAMLLTTRAASATPTSNGPYINGPYINGPYINGPFIQGTVTNGQVGAALLNGGDIVTSSGTITVPASTGPDKLPWVHPGLYGSELHGGSYEGGVLKDRRGVDVVGAEVWASLADGDGAIVQAVKLHIDGAEAVSGGTYANGLLRDPYFHYFVSIEDANGGLTPMCGAGAAVALRGEWSYQSGNVNGGAKISDDAAKVTFGCENGALGKCAAKLGYRPWETNRVQTCSPSGCEWTTESMVGMHQACTRMVRADYCGDGVTHTVPNVDLEVFDDLGAPEASDGFSPSTQINRNTLPDPAPGWQFEATWQSTGATSAACGRLQQSVVTCPSYSVTRPVPGLSPLATPIRTTGILGRGGVTQTTTTTIVKRDICTTTPFSGSVITDYRRTPLVLPRFPFPR